MYFDQSEYFRRLADGLTDGEKLIPRLQRILGVNYAKARRLVRGENELKAGELLLITAAFPEATEFTTTLLRSTQMRLVYRRAFSDFAGFMDYLQSVEALMRRAADAVNSKLYYCARDLPLFVFLKERSLATLKLNLWCRSLRQEGLTPIPEALWRKMNDLVTLYREVDSHEVWDNQALETQCRQLLAFARSKTITYDEAEELLEALRRSMLWISTYVNKEEKSEGVDFKLWTSDYLTANNSVAFRMDDEKYTVYPTGHAKFYGTSSAEAHADFMRDWKQHLNYAQPITHSSPVHVENWTQQVQTVLAQCKKDLDTLRTGTA